MDETARNLLGLRIESKRGRPELRPLVDGRDLLTAGFHAHQLGPDPRFLLGPYSPLLPGAAPREVRLVRAGCGEECCGALYVTVGQEGGTVRWDGWRNPDVPELELPAYRFDAGQYAAELDSAGGGVEGWPARSVGRLLEGELVRRPEVLAAWECELDTVWTWPAAPDRIELTFYHPAVPEDRGDVPWLQFLAELTAADGDPAERAAEIVERLATTDPRTWARVCGGSARYAELLGHPWPEGF